MHPTYDLSPRSNACRARNCSGKAIDGQDYCARCREEMNGTPCPFRALLSDLFPGTAARLQGMRARRELAALKPHCGSFEHTIRTPEQRQKMQRKAINDALGVVLITPLVIVVIAILWPVICEAYDSVHAPVTVGNAMASYGAQGWEGHK